jgi:ABC-2 type transport system permease protein
LKGFWILLKRELKSITREKTIMFAIMIQFFIASFSSVILVGIMAFYDPASISENSRAKISLGLVEATPTPMCSYLTQNKDIQVVKYSDAGVAEEAFKNGRVNAVMIIPAGSAGVVDMKLMLPELDTQKTVIMMLLQEPLKNYENYLRKQNGVMVGYTDLGGKSSNTYEFLYSIIIPILMLFPALIAGSIMIDSVSEEFENKTFDTLIAAPVSLHQIFSAKIAASIITAILQVLLWIFLLRLNGLVIQNPVLVALIAVLSATAISFSAALVALFFKDRERAQFIYSIVLIILVSGTYFVGISPISLITRLSSGVPDLGLLNLGIFLISILILGGIFFGSSKRLIFTKQ